MGAVPLTACPDFSNRLNDVIVKAEANFLDTAELYKVLEHDAPALRNSGYANDRAPSKPTAGSLYLIDKNRCRSFRKDGVKWVTNPDGKTVRERHMKLKVAGKPLINCYYAHEQQDGPQLPLTRRCYWLLYPNTTQQGLVLVHYLDNTEESGNSSDDPQQPTPPVRLPRRASPGRSSPRLRGSPTQPVGEGIDLQHYRPEPAFVPGQSVAEQAALAPAAGAGAGAGAGPGDYNGVRFQEGSTTPQPFYQQQSLEQAYALGMQQPEAATSLKWARAGTLEAAGFVQAAPGQVPAGFMEHLLMEEEEELQLDDPFLSYLDQQAQHAQQAQQVEMDAMLLPEFLSGGGQASFSQEGLPDLWDLVAEGGRGAGAGAGAAAPPSTVESVHEAFASLSTPTSALEGSLPRGPLEFEDLGDLDFDLQFTIEDYEPKQDSTSGGAMVLITGELQVAPASVPGRALRASFGGVEVPAELLPRSGAVRCRVPPALRQDSHTVSLVLTLSGMPLSGAVPFTYTAAAVAAGPAAAALATAATGSSSGSGELLPVAAWGGAVAGGYAAQQEQQAQHAEEQWAQQAQQQPQAGAVAGAGSQPAPDLFSYVSLGVGADLSGGASAQLNIEGASTLDMQAAEGSAAGTAESAAGMDSWHEPWWIGGAAGAAELSEALQAGQALLGASQEGLPGGRLDFEQELFDADEADLQIEAAAPAADATAVASGAGAVYEREPVQQQQPQLVPAPAPMAMAPAPAPMARAAPAFEAALAPAPMLGASPAHAAAPAPQALPAFMPFMAAAPAPPTAAAQHAQPAAMATPGFAAAPRPAAAVPTAPMAMPAAAFGAAPAPAPMRRAAPVMAAAPGALAAAAPRPQPAPVAMSAAAAAAPAPKAKPAPTAMPGTAPGFTAGPSMQTAAMAAPGAQPGSMAAAAVGAAPGSGAAPMPVPPAAAVPAPMAMPVAAPGGPAGFPAEASAPAPAPTTMARAAPAFAAAPMPAAAAAGPTPAPAAAVAAAGAGAAAAAGPSREQQMLAEEQPAAGGAAIPPAPAPARAAAAAPAPALPAAAAAGPLEAMQQQRQAAEAEAAKQLQRQLQVQPLKPGAVLQRGSEASSGSPGPSATAPRLAPALLGKAGAAGSQAQGVGAMAALRAGRGSAGEGAVRPGPGAMVPYGEVARASRSQPAGRGILGALGAPIRGLLAGIGRAALGRPASRQLPAARAAPQEESQASTSQGVSRAEERDGQRKKELARASKQEQQQEQPTTDLPAFHPLKEGAQQQQQEQEQEQPSTAPPVSQTPSKEGLGQASASGGASASATAGVSSSVPQEPSAAAAERHAEHARHAELSMHAEPAEPAAAGSPLGGSEAEQELQQPGQGAGRERELTQVLGALSLTAGPLDLHSGGAGGSGSGSGSGGIVSAAEGAGRGTHLQLSGAEVPRVLPSSGGSGSSGNSNGSGVTSREGDDPVRTCLEQGETEVQAAQAAHTAHAAQAAHAALAQEEDVAEGGMVQEALAKLSLSSPEEPSSCSSPAKRQVTSAGLPITAGSAGAGGSGPGGELATVGLPTAAASAGLAGASSGWPGSQLQPTAGSAGASSGGPHSQVATVGRPTAGLAGSGSNGPATQSAPQPPTADQPTAVSEGVIEGVGEGGNGSALEDKRGHGQEGQE